MKTIAAFVCSLILIGITLASPKASAGAALGSVNLTTSPVSTALVGVPGGSVSTMLHVQNNSAVAETINVELQTFKAYGTAGAAQMMPFPAGDLEPSWVNLSETSFVAQPGVWNAIKMTINLPKGAGLGYYYAVVFKPQINAAQKTLGSAVKGGNAILVLVNAQNGNEHPKVSIARFSTDKSFYEYLPVNFSVAIKNSGNIFLAPTGDIYISRSQNFSSALATIPVNESEGNVLAQSSRVFSAQWADGFPAFVPKTIDGEKITNKKGQVEQTLQWNFANANKVRFGRYYAHLVMAYNDGSRDIPIEATISFWVIPWKILSVSLVILIVICVGLFVSGRKLVARTVRLSTKVKSRKGTDA